MHHEYPLLSVSHLRPDPARFQKNASGQVLTGFVALTFQMAHIKIRKLNYSTGELTMSISQKSIVMHICSSVYSSLVKIDFDLNETTCLNKGLNYNFKKVKLHYMTSMFFIITLHLETSSSRNILLPFNSCKTLVE